MAEEEIRREVVVERKPKATPMGGAMLVVTMTVFLIAVVAGMYNFAPDPEAVHPTNGAQSTSVPIRPVQTVPVSPPSPTLR